MVANPISALKWGFASLFVLVIFLYGISLGTTLSPEIPATAADNSITGSLSRTIGLVVGDDGTTERISPNDHIAESDVHVYTSHIVIDLEDARWATFTDTNSMDPTIDVGTNSIEIVPIAADQISVGDIISYRRGESIIIHRVIETGTDEQGWYAYCKGDNNQDKDPDRVRFSQVTGIVVAVLY